MPGIEMIEKNKNEWKRKRMIEMLIQIRQRDKIFYGPKTNRKQRL